jgi:hypothetical protein
MVKFWKKKKRHGYITLPGETQQERTEWRTPKSPTTSQPRYICHPVCGCVVEATESVLRAYERCDICIDEEWAKRMTGEWEMRWAVVLQDADAFHNPTLRQLVEKAKERDRPEFQATLAALPKLSDNLEHYRMVLDCIWSGIDSAGNYVRTTKLLEMLDRT